MHLLLMILGVMALGAALSIAAAACFLCSVVFRSAPGALVGAVLLATTVVMGPAVWNLWRVSHGATGVLRFVIPALYCGLMLPLSALLLSAASAAAPRSASAGPRS